MGTFVWSDLIFEVLQSLYTETGDAIGVKDRVSSMSHLHNLLTDLFKIERLWVSVYRY